MEMKLTIVEDLLLARHFTHTLTESRQCLEKQASSSLTDKDLDFREVRWPALVHSVGKQRCPV